MKLSEIFEKLNAKEKKLFGSIGADPEIARLEYDSRRVSRDGGGVIYSCVKGDNSDGHDFAECAVASGAVALLCERELPVDVPQIIAPRTRAVMGEAASVLYGRPAEKLKMIGLTGTNGKTTTTYIVRSMIRASGERVGMIGTIIYDDSSEETFAEHTTPEGPDVQLLLSRMAANRAGYCVMEASSHGLHQGRIEGCRYDAVGFSNLTPEHLEYHEDMDHYFEAKRRLFADYTRGDWRGAVNSDDEYGRRLIGEFGGNVSAFSLGLHILPGAYRVSIRDADINGMTVGVRFPDGRSFAAESSLTGNYNASNILEAATIADAMGFDIETIRRGINSCPQIPGRLERYPFANGVNVFVDFAHSSDGMQQALETLAGLAKGKVRVLWGAGGDRTPVKRPVVGEIMARLADHVVISNDNPRNEDPASIARDVERGVKMCPKPVRCETILNREEAINFILDSAEPGDVVLIAGKGPERHIDFGTYKIPFLDADKVMEWARARSQEVSEK
ncbi:MAG: UDP-N-acetylmuramoyl-L-alanyl-D-glutamate--2,6-diaminopimelate ligase, partial [Synergistaceae bacterium]|jgi:UDP-N-acetylmuramoyl-L-alanyl-D-glutamate--2,6-diaminopimelate ligase|nr:UDP-N-acetylmuramoyl-L-alanyl-D-glutamate--2,6-diaminopimelate ligase [Synergistaceae bacterium]